MSVHVACGQRVPTLVANAQHAATCAGCPCGPQAAKRELFHSGMDVALGTAAMSNFKVVLSLSGVAALSAVLIGCTAKPVPQRSAGAWVGDEGASSAVVFASPDVIAASGSRQIAQSDWRDDSLNIRPVQSAYDQAAWPDARRPSLDRPRRIYFYNQSNTYTYFRAEGVRVQSERGYLFP